MDVIWTQVDRDVILDVLHADLSVEKQDEIASFDDDEFARFIGRLFAVARVEFHR